MLPIILEGHIRRQPSLLFLQGSEVLYLSHHKTHSASRFITVPVGLLHHPQPAFQYHIISLLGDRS